MNYIYYLSFVYLDKRGNQQFGSTLYSMIKAITDEADIKHVAEMLHMHYDTKHLRILAFSPMKISTSFEHLQEIFAQIALELFNGKRWRQKIKAWRIKNKKGGKLNG